MEEVIFTETGTEIVMENSLKRSAQSNEDESLASEQKKLKLEEHSTKLNCTDASDKKISNETSNANNLKGNSLHPELVDGKHDSDHNVERSESVLTNNAVNSTNSIQQDQVDTSDKQTSPVSSSSGRMTEVDVGITEYLGSHTESFSAVIKQRYSDFIVNEIDEDGNVVHLKKITHEEEKEEDKDEEDEKNANDSSCSILSDEDRTAIESIVTQHQKDASHNILAPEDKDLRTKIHLAIKQTFPQLETTTTEDDTGNKVIKVMWRKGKTRDVIRDEWPKSKKSCRYVQFVLYKENKDTMDAIGLIAKNLKVRESMFQYAGTKDRRAKTSQEITAHRVHPKKLAGLNKVLWNMGLGDFRYVQQPLQLGQLSGNYFTIVLRNIQTNVKVVDAAMASLKVSGFINYFGMQRFGTTSIPTHQIGSTLLKGDWEKAIDLILAPRNDVPAKDKFQKKWAETKDPALTLEVTPRFCGLERNILEALKKKAKPRNALDKLPRNSRLLYLHSYQSLVWNKMVSRRLKHLGHSVVVGDLVMDLNSDKPRVVTEENVGNYTLTDLVLPLPGHDVIYPTNQVGEWYKEMLAADDLDIDNMKRPQKDYSLPGAYRHLVVIPKDVDWSHCKYNDFTQPLTLSDLDILQGEKLPDCVDKGTMSAVVVRMSLSTSCYATMALREVMRIDTSSFHQSSLNESS